MDATFRMKRCRIVDNIRPHPRHLFAHDKNRSIHGVIFFSRSKWPSDFPPIRAVQADHIIVDTSRRVGYNICTIKKIML